MPVVCDELETLREEVFIAHRMACLKEVTETTRISVRITVLGSEIWSPDIPDTKPTSRLGHIYCWHKGGGKFVAILN
jgi:hypothetical protein